MKFNQYIKKNVEDAREKYRDAGYQNVRCIGAIITRKQRLAKEKSDALYESSYKDWLPEGTLPVCDNKNK